MLPKTIQIKNKKVFLIDQTIIPKKLKIIEIKTCNEMFDAIKTMVVRGAPAIGVAAAAGMALFIDQLTALQQDKIQQAGEFLKKARPTAVNLMWAVDKVIAHCGNFNDLNTLKNAIWNLVEKMAQEDEAINRAMGKNGADLIPKNKKVNILTHCNAGSLATVYWGTALGVIRELHQRSQVKHVYADETRPRLQGGKLTAWELLQDNIPVTVITDNMAAYMMQQGKIDVIFVGADRIAANGDAANKIGTFGLAIVANYHKVPFYVVAPKSTIDIKLATGKEIEIEERDSTEVTHINNQTIMPKEVDVANPAFDVTPHELITGIVTEKKVIVNNLHAEICDLFS
ncbi:MAG: S-methyl-5-thioribose-1-phosphate isomerase [Gammaproteobacteria bacterium]|jgi:methylthioribose-1-phosphate isomerase